MSISPNPFNENQSSAERILLVDDNPTNLQVLYQTLDGRGYTLLVAKDGQSALEITDKAGPDLILLDIMMPEVDGYEVCRRLKANPDTREIPVIFLSALGETKDKVQGLDVGAVDYITKPFQAEEVIARVNTHLTIYRLKRELQQKHDELEHELKMVAAEQRKILPKKLPDIENLDLAVHYQTSRYAGGDYYDILALPHNRWGIMIADVSGHSTQAAVLMAMTCTLLRSYPDFADNPDPVMRHLNEHLCELANDSFITALYAVYDAGRRRMTIARCGHMPPLLFRPADGRTVEITCKGTYPLAIEKYEDLPLTEIQLIPGDRLLFYTDGISERFNPQGEQYEVKRLFRQLGRDCNDDPRQLIEVIVDDVHDFAGGLPPEDDQALLMAFVR